jgi:hypothetical protein
LIEMLRYAPVPQYVLTAFVCPHMLEINIDLIPPSRARLNSPYRIHHVSVPPTVDMNSKLHSGRTRIRSLEDSLHTDRDGSIKSMPITLVDHTVTPSENSPSLWARNAKVVDYVIVSGSRTRAGAYVAWNCLIETFEVCAVRSDLPFDLQDLRLMASSYGHRALNSLFSKGTLNSRPCEIC